MDTTGVEKRRAERERRKAALREMEIVSVDLYNCECYRQEFLEAKETGLA